MSHSLRFARKAQRVAAETRRRAGAARDMPICVFDLSEKLGLEVKFRPEASLEGMYCKGSPGVILVPTYRPPGRQAFSCAHELGHHVLGHGTRVDEYLGDGCESCQNSPDERLADSFAAHLLMPIAAVRRAFASRKWESRQANAEQAYVVACYLGVGYDTLINHMFWALALLDNVQYGKLRNFRPKQLRLQLLGEATEGHLAVIDSAWTGRSVDLSVGDRAIIPPGTQVEGRSIVISQSRGIHTVVEGVRPGISRIESGKSSWAAYVRVARREYVGRNRFRFAEDPDET